MTANIEWLKSHSPDRHLRVMAIKNNMRETSPVIGKALTIMQKEPSVLSERAADFDEILNMLNYRLVRSEYIKEPELFPNIFALKEKLNGFTLNNSSIGSVSDDFFHSRNPFEGLNVFKNAEETFKEINKLIRNGEWAYINEIEDPLVAVSALLIEGWGLFFEKNSNIEGIRPLFVRAFEEEMGYEYSNKTLWKDVKDWVIEEKDLFSPKFIEKIS